MGLGPPLLSVPGHDAPWSALPPAPGANQMLRLPGWGAVLPPHLVIDTDRFALVPIAARAMQVPTGRLVVSPTTWCTTASSHGLAGLVLWLERQLFALQTCASTAFAAPFNVPSHELQLLALATTWTMQRTEACDRKWIAARNKP